MKSRSPALPISLFQPREVAYLSINSRQVWEHMLPAPNQWGEDWLRFGIGAEAKIEAASNQPAGPRTLEVGPNTRVDLDKLELTFESNVGGMEGGDGAEGWGWVSGCKAGSDVSFCPSGAARSPPLRPPWLGHLLH